MVIRKNGPHQWNRYHSPSKEQSLPIRKEVIYFPEQEVRTRCIELIIYSLVKILQILK